MVVVMATSRCWRVVVVVMVVVMGMLLPASVRGRTVSVTSIKMTPYLMEVKDPKAGRVTYEGYIPELLDELSGMVGVNFTIRTLAKQFGELDPVTGRWSGLVGHLVNGDVDMAAAPLTVTGDRAQVMDYSVPFQYFGGVIVLKRIPVVAPSFSQHVQFILTPLEDSVWLMMMVAYLLTSVILYVICHVNPYEWRHLCADHQATRREAESFTCLNTFWFLLSTLMWQGFVRAPRSLGGRLVTMAWWAFVVVFLLTYTASLTNLLRANPMNEKDVNIRILGFKDLASEHSGDMDVGFVRGGSTSAYLRNSQSSHLFRLWRGVEERGTAVEDVEEGLERVKASYSSNSRSRPFALLTESTLVQQMVRQEPCNMYMVGDTSMSGSYSLAFRRMASDLRDRVDLSLLALQENGILKMLEDKWFGGPCHAHVLDTTLHHADQDILFYPVNLGSLSGVMIILAAGVIVGAIVTVLEIVVFKVAEKLSDEDRQLPRREETEGKGEGVNAPNMAMGTQNVSSV
ncbi:glutamate receptor 1-like [Babylonia areolata]|uniref:glutamate receptor 1-like n=1 Tax=Babylonia areolata TaxID=304850 RepID=UPI003FCEF3DF